MTFVDLFTYERKGVFWYRIFRTFATAMISQQRYHFLCHARYELRPEEQSFARTQKKSIFYDVVYSTTTVYEIGREAVNDEGNRYVTGSFEKPAGKYLPHSEEGEMKSKK